MDELLQKLKERLLGAKLDDCISSGAYRDISSLITEIEQLHKHNVMPSLPDGLIEGSNCDDNYKQRWIDCFNKIKGNCLER